MRDNAFRSSLLGLLATFAAALLASCGGGGSTNNDLSVQGGPLGVNGGTAYAGVPFTLVITGGRAPYTLSSSEPGIFPLPLQTSANSIAVIPSNPGVVDTGLKPEDLQGRTANVTVHDSSVQTASSKVFVGQNFLTGYGITLTPNNCPPPPSGSTAVVTACAGGTTAIRFSAIFGGALGGNRVFTLQVLRGNYSIRNPATGQSGSSITTNSDHDGTVTALIDVNNGAPSQVAVIRIIDAATGVYADEVFLISAAVTGTNTLSAVPGTITFNGVLATDCGGGTADVLIFDGTPPYTAISPDNRVSITPATSNTNPGRFTITVAASAPPCGPRPVVFQDSTGARLTYNVISAAGTGTIPTTTAITVSSNTLTLGCGQTGSVSVAGGTGLYTVTSTHPRIIPFTFGNAVGATRATGDGASVFPTTGTVSVTDGNSIANITVTVPANCP